MRLVIVTRLGVGVARPSYFRYHTSIMRASLYQSLKAQTDIDFEWVVICDSRIDEGSRSEIENLIEPVGGRVLLFDPIAKGRLLPHAKEILGRLDSRLLVMSRIDDDDVIASDFVETVKREASMATKLPCTIAWSEGVELYVRERLYRKFHNPHIALGLSVVSKQDSPISPYSGNHRKIHEATIAAGGENRIIATDFPKWVYVRRPESDSTEVRQDIWPKNIAPVDEFVNSVLTSCGLPNSWLNDTAELILNDQDPKPEIFGLKKLARMQIKGELIKLVREMHAKEETDTIKYHAIVNALYAI